MEALFDRLPEPLIAVREVGASGRSTARLDDETVTAGRLALATAGARRDPRPARPAAAARRGLAAGPARRVRRARRGARAGRRRGRALAGEPGRARRAGDRPARAAPPAGAPGARGGGDRRGAGCVPGEAAEITGQLAAAQHGETIAAGRGARSARRSSARAAGRASRSRARSRSCGRSRGSTAAGTPLADRLAGLEAEVEDVAAEVRVARRDRRPRSGDRSRGSRSGWARSTGCCGATATTRPRSSRTASGPRPRRSGCAASRTSARRRAADDARLLLEVADAAASAVDPARGDRRRARLGGRAPCSPSSGSRPTRSRSRSAAGRRRATTRRSRWTATPSRSTRPASTRSCSRSGPTPGEPARPLARIASGGELSRVALAVKQVLAEVDDDADARVRRDRHRDRRAERGPGRAQPVDAGPRPPGAVRDAPAADRRLRGRPLPDRQARARRPDGHRDHPPRPRGTRGGARPDDRRRGRAARRRGCPRASCSTAPRRGARAASPTRPSERDGARPPTPNASTGRSRTTSPTCASSVASPTRRSAPTAATSRDFAMSRGAAARWASGPEVAQRYLAARARRGRPNDPGLAPTSLRRRAAAIRGFYRFAYGDGLIDVDVAAHLDLPRQPRLLPETLTVDEVERAARGRGRRAPAGRHAPTDGRRPCASATGRCSSSCTRPGCACRRRSGSTSAASSLDAGVGAGHRQGRPRARRPGRRRRDRVAGAVPRLAARRRGSPRPAWPTAPTTPAVRHAARRAARPAAGLGGRQGGGRGRRARRPRVAAHAAPLVRDPPARGRRRPARRPGAPRACQHLDDAAVHAPDRRADPRGLRPRPSAGLRRGEATAMSYADSLLAAGRTHRPPGAPALVRARLARALGDPGARRSGTPAAVARARTSSGDTPILDALGYLTLALFVFGIASIAWGVLRYRSEEYLDHEPAGDPRRRASSTSARPTRRSRRSTTRVLTESLFGRMFGFGDLEVLTASESGIERLRMLRDAKVVQEGDDRGQARAGGRPRAADGPPLRPLAPARRDRVPPAPPCARPGARPGRRHRPGLERAAAVGVDRPRRRRHADDVIGELERLAATPRGAARSRPRRSTPPGATCSTASEPAARPGRSGRYDTRDSSHHPRPA